MPSEITCISNVYSAFNFLVISIKMYWNFNDRCSMVNYITTLKVAVVVVVGFYDTF